jgi:hypothetical protein
MTPMLNIRDVISRRSGTGTIFYRLAPKRSVSHHGHAANGMVKTGVVDFTFRCRLLKQLFYRRFGVGIADFDVD